MPHSVAYIQPPFAALTLILACSVNAVACESATCTCERPPIRCFRQGGWSVAISTNFHVCSLRGTAEAQATAERCEEVRASLTRTWQFSEQGTWSPKCQVVLYPSASPYVAAIGPGSETSFGSSLVRPATGTITSRRIDLRTDSPDYLVAALPHEMCHLLIADRFRNRPAPLWYDEGLALLMDKPEKLKLHERDLRDGLRKGTAFRLSEILAAESYPEAHRVPVFYGQCAALTQLLLTEGEPRKIHAFAERLTSLGANAALRATYDIPNFNKLERKWLRGGLSLPSPSAASHLLTQDSGEHFAFASVSKVDTPFGVSDNKSDVSHIPFHAIDNGRPSGPSLRSLGHQLAAERH